MPTMKDVAKAAGVSLGTVSNVLNRPQSVRAGKRARVLEAIDKLGFRSNMTARALKTKLTQNIGLIIPSITNPYYPELARGVEDAAQKAGLTVFLCNDDRDLGKERAYIHALLSKNVDGIILVKPRIRKEELLKISTECALVLVDRKDPLQMERKCGTIDVDNEVGARQAMDLLYQSGHRKIAFISGLIESISSRTRYETYLSFLKAKQLPVRPEYIIQGDWTRTSGHTAAHSLMALEDLPSALFAANDMMAIGAIKAFQEQGVQIPSDLSIVGFDNIDLSNACSPSLTTIHQPKYEVGLAGVSMLLALMSYEGHPETGNRLMHFESKLIVRDSVGPYRPPTAQG